LARQEHDEEYFKEMRMSKINFLVSAFALAFAVDAATGVARADAGAFLRSIEGSFRGSGTAAIPGRDEVENVSCRVSNAYDQQASALVVSGNCATTQAKSAVKGQLTHNGDSVSGSLISTAGGTSQTSSSGEVNGNTLVVSTNFIDNRTGKLTRSRQVVSKTGGGFRAEFYTYDNRAGKFMKAGSIRFTGN
jgi:hypothetical protein